MPTAEKYKDDYVGLAANIDNVDQIVYFDDLRKETTKARHQAANIVKDPAAKYEELSKLFTQIKQDIAFFAGRDPQAQPAQKPTRLEEMIRIGLRAIDEKL